jgi:hypothetical protein
MEISNKYVSEDKICPLFEKLHNICLYSSGIKWGGQTDSQEMFSCIIDKTCEFLNLKDMFSFNLVTSSYCEDGNIETNKENRKEECLLLPLELYKNCNSLLELIHEYKTPEILETPLARCTDLKNSYRKLDISIPPENKYLIIQLKRFYYDKRFKFNSRKIDIQHIINISNSKYVLDSCILRIGGDSGGHYVCAIYRNGKLVRVYNDSRVTNNLEYFKLEEHGYLFVYRKISNNNNNNLSTNKLSLRKSSEKLKDNRATKSNKLSTKKSTQKSKNDELLRNLKSNINKKIITYKKDVGILEHEKKLINRIYDNEENIKKSLKKINNNEQKLKENLILLKKTKKTKKTNTLYNQYKKSEFGKILQKEYEKISTQKNSKLKQIKKNYKLAKKLQKNEIKSYLKYKNNYKLSKKNQINNNYKLAQQLQENNIKSYLKNNNNNKLSEKKQIISNYKLAQKIEKNEYV